MKKEKLTVAAADMILVNLWLMQYITALTKKKIAFIIIRELLKLKSLKLKSYIKIILKNRDYIMKNLKI